LFHTGRLLSIDDHDAVLVDGTVACAGGDFDPWLEQDQVLSRRSGEATRPCWPPTITAPW
jgi:hypothetical protein